MMKALSGRQYRPMKRQALMQGLLAVALLVWDPEVSGVGAPK